MRNASKKCIRNVFPSSEVLKSHSVHVAINPWTPLQFEYCMNHRAAQCIHSYPLTEEVFHKALLFYSCQQFKSMVKWRREFISVLQHCSFQLFATLYLALDTVYLYCSFLYFICCVGNCIMSAVQWSHLCILRFRPTVNCKAKNSA